MYNDVEMDVKVCSIKKSKENEGGKEGRKEKKWVIIIK